MSARVAEPVTLRHRTPTDTQAIERLARAAFTEYSWERGRVRLERTLTVVACRGVRLVGFVILELSARELGTIPAIAVDEREQGKGVGRRLLAAAERLARERGVRELTLHTAQANVAAFELFAKSGYRLVRRIPRYYRGVFDACEMLKRL